MLELRGVSKAFPGVQALHDVSFNVAPGEVHALLGANGAGKSTLIKILAGALQRDAGEIVFAGQRVDGLDPQDAAKRGVAVLHQEPALVPFLNVEQNLFLGQERTGRFGLLKQREQRRTAKEILGRIAPNLDSKRVIADLRTSERQLVALARAFLSEPKLMILDEPTASMTEPEIRALFDVVRQARDGGTSIIYITHRLDEVFQVADTATVLRDGRHIASTPIGQINRDELVTLIAGRALHRNTRDRRAEGGDRILAVKGLTRQGFFSDIDFDVRKGEIVALAGLVGAGRTEIVRSIFGLDPLDSGEVFLPDGTFGGDDPSHAVRAGVAMVPEDRKTQGIVPEMSVRDNLLLSSLGQCTGRMGFLDSKRIAERVARSYQHLDIRPTNSEDRLVQTLSGGNQQKVIFARAVESGARLLILDEPTAGVDVGAKSEIHQLIFRLAGEGLGVLLISSEMEEVAELADRVLVVREGRIVSELPGHSASSFELVARALGEHRNKEDIHG